MSLLSATDRPLLRKVQLGLALAAVTGMIGMVVVIGPSETLADCPPGYEHPVEQALPPDVMAQLPPGYQGGVEIEYMDVLQDSCVPVDRAESFADLALRDLQWNAARTAPFTRVAPGATSAAAEERQALIAADPDVAGADGTWAEYGVGPLNFDDPRYGEVNRQGLVDSTGRIDDFEYDPDTNRLFAAIGTGGVWLSDDLGDNWRPITDNLPSTVSSAVGYTPVGGPDGTVVVLTGEHTFGGFAFVGIGAYYSHDLGATWTRSDGVPDAALGFAVEVDPTDPNIVYAATGMGLYRSADAGVTFTDVVLPTGDCAGNYNLESCLFANFVTDVVLKEPGGVGEDTEGGTVVAAVGWRAGMMENPDGSIQSEHNGLYRSETGEPGSFEPMPGLADASGGQERLGRIEMGPATGPEQDHDFLYAVVQDAVLFNAGPATSPVPDLNELGLSTTVFNGVYVSEDFGGTWTLLADDNKTANSCLVNQSAFCIQGPAGAGLNVTPGVQAWFNMWVLPDPTQAVGGVPSRVLFGLEEVWQSRLNGTPQNTPLASFEVIGRYFADPACLIGECVVNTAGPLVTTVHPDQHEAIILPTDEGPLLLVGHDGGLSRQLAGPAGIDDFDQNSWDLEQENGLHTLLPYSTVMANDGVVYAGLQDNGNMRISPEDGFRKFETFGADGTFAAVDPANSDYTWEASQGGNMRVSIDGGQTWRLAVPPADNKRFVNPFVMDPLDPNHLTSGGRQINETLVGPNTADGEEGNGWITVFDLGTASPDEDIPTADQPAPVNNGMSAIDTRGDATYVGFCGVCDILNQASPFRNGIATNVGGEQPAQAGTGDGWHFATAEGLPDRFITSVAIDPLDASQQTIYVTLGGYSRQWVPPGSINDGNTNIGDGHLYKSTDAGETFTDISGNLPDLPATWVEPRGDQLLVATDNGVYISSDTSGGEFAVLGGGQLPATPTTSLQLKPDDPNVLVAGLYGRGVWTYEFAGGAPLVDRIGGADRITTAALVAQEGYDTAETVAIARADVYADALAGAPLAFREDAPLLLTATDELSAASAAEVERLGATRALLFGGDTALSPQVEEDLAAAGITEIERFEGADRFATAAAIAGEVGGSEVYVTKGNDVDPTRGWPDAMSIAPVAAVQGTPILLTETDFLPDATAQALTDLGAQTGRIVGGEAAVSQAVADELAEQIRLGQRVAGANRYETSVAAAMIGRDAGLSPSGLFLARGGDFPDALAAGPTVAALGDLLLLVDEQSLANSPATRDYMAALGCVVRSINLLGGTAAISTTVEDQVEALFADCVQDSVPAPPDPDPSTGNPPGQTGPTAVGEPIAGPFGFEESDDGWTVSTGGNPTTMWARQEGGDDSATAFAVAPYGDLAATTLTSPVFEGDGRRVFLEFANRYDVEGGGFDETAVEFTTDGGESWTVLATLGGQNTGYPNYSDRILSFLPGGAGDFQVRFSFFSDFICASTPTLPGVCARPDGYEGTFLDDILLSH